MPHLLLLIPTISNRTHDFLEGAQRVQLDSRIEARPAA